MGAIKGAARSASVGHLGVTPSAAPGACLPQGTALGGGDGCKRLTRHECALRRNYVKKKILRLTVTFWATNAVREWYGKKKDE